ncbi:olfactory receptor 2AP1-like [Discoglossus pictus]
MANQSVVFEFVLIGFPGLPQKFHTLISILLFIAYNISLFANGTVIALIFLKPHLNHAMYILIANLAFSDLFFDTATLPVTIAIYWFGAKSLSFSGCMTQIFFVHLMGGVDSFILMLMAIDRYVAICNPLRYSSIINNKLISLFLFFSWVCAGIIPSIIVGMDVTLPYCGPNKVNNCFCTHPSVVVLACTDVSFVRRMAFYIAYCALCGPLVIIILSYIFIIKTICSRQSDTWEKAFYTCSTHLLVIGLYFLPRLFVYSTSQIPLILPSDMNVLLLFLYTFVPHLASPVIYCLRTQEIKRTLGSVLKGKIFNKIEDLHPTTIAFKGEVSP